MTYFKDFLFKNKDKVSYLFFGILTTIVNVVIFQIADMFGLKTAVSTVLAWFVSVIFAFITNKLYVFESKKKKLQLLIEAFLFISGRIITGILDVAFMMVFVDIFRINGLLIKVISNVVVIIVNYIFGKLIFRRYSGGKKC